MSLSHEQYLRRISFALTQPLDDVELGIGQRGTRPGLKASTLAYESRNTNLPEAGDETRVRLRPLMRVPKMSTFAIAAVINRIVSGLPPDSTYVNVGVWHGFTLLAGLLGNPDARCVGVDNFTQFGGPRQAFLRRFRRHASPHHEFHECGFEEYFANADPRRIGLYVYDAGHTYEEQLAGLSLAEPFFADDCLILVDDTNWSAPRQATMDFVAQSHHRYRIVFDVSTHHNGHPTYWNGMMVLSRAGTG
jgi:hypothetical protein